MIHTAPLNLTTLVNLANYQLWDFAGIDGLQVAKFLIGQTADRIAPFQSLETTWSGGSCSLLRLCENNFRIGLQDGSKFEQTMRQLQPDRRFWYKRCDYLQSIALPEAIGLDLLTKIAVPKPPYRLVGLQPNCAIPARINRISVLIWRHRLFSEQPVLLEQPVSSKQPVFEVQMAKGNLEAIAL
jgi:hypothetical protein